MWRNEKLLAWMVTEINVHILELIKELLKISVFLTSRGSQPWLYEEHRDIVKEPRRQSKKKAGVFSGAGAEARCILSGGDFGNSLIPFSFADTPEGGPMRRRTPGLAGPPKSFLFFHWTITTVSVTECLVLKKRSWPRNAPACVSFT